MYISTTESIVPSTFIVSAMAEGESHVESVDGGRAQSVLQDVDAIQLIVQAIDRLQHSKYPSLSIDAASMRWPNQTYHSSVRYSSLKSVRTLLKLIMLSLQPW